MVESDLDVVIVAERFEGTPWPDRTSRVLLAAHVVDPLEILCYAPTEFAVKRTELGIVQAAVSEGRRVFKRGVPAPRTRKSRVKRRA